MQRQPSQPSMKEATPKNGAENASTPKDNDNQMIEEKIVNKDTGEVSYRKYIKGRFLGKVIKLLSQLLGWLRSMS